MEGRIRMSGVYERLQKLSQKQLISLVMELQKRAEGKDASEDEIAVIGLGCRFPGGANSPKKYWEMLSRGIDAVGTVPLERWDPNMYKFFCNMGGFLKDVDISAFDPVFFGISAIEAKQMSPLQRLLLEVSWEALEYAGIVPAELSGSKTGVFVGVSQDDYGCQQSEEDKDAYSAAGSSFSVIAGRLSYLLGLEGPSIVIDTACSSSLVAVHQACQSLKQKECNMAITGGINLLITPGTYKSLSQANMLAQDGKCKTFDADADGYARGEGCGVIILKRLSDAVRDGDEIMAVISGSAVNHNGRSGGLTVPKGTAQAEVIEKALAQAKLMPDQVAYIEAHGTGTSLGDLIELQALGEVFGKYHSMENPLLIGSVKTNIGHLEGAAGVAGLIKTILSIYYRQIPAHLNVKKRNTHISLEDIHGQIPDTLTDWPSAYKKRVAGVSSFGFGGTNAHVVLQQAPKRQEIYDREKPYYVLALSGKSESALRDSVKDILVYCMEHPEDNISQISYECNNRRTKFNQKIAICLSKEESLQEKLQAVLSDDSLFDMKLPDAGLIEDGIYRGVTETDIQPKLAFVYNEYVKDFGKIGKKLYEYLPVFRAVINQCNAIVEEKINVRIAEVLLDENTESDERISKIASFCLQYALSEQMKAFHVIPYFIYAQGLGKIAAACSLEYLQLEAAIQFILDKKEPENAEWYSTFLENGKTVNDFSELVRHGVQVIIQFGSAKEATAQNIQTLSFIEKGKDAYEVFLGYLCRLYILGSKIKWDSLNEKAEKRLLDFPTYPFQRKRYWVGNRPPKQCAGLRESMWEQMEFVQEGWKEIEKQPEKQLLYLPNIRKEKQQLELFCIHSIGKTFKNMGAFQTGFSTKEEFMKECGIQERYEQLMDAWLGHLVAHHMLEQKEKTYGNLRMKKGNENIDCFVLEQSAVLAKECAKYLEEVLTGKMEPQEVFFKDGSFEILDGIYKNNTISIFFNSTVKEFCQNIMDFLSPNQKVRVLEIGAGTGSLTESVLEAFPMERVEYVFTDISNSFLNRAKERFGKYSNIQYRILDIEKDIIEQGFENETFDLILASNVVHATKNIKEALEHISSALASNGLLMLIELTKPTAFFDMTFGLVKGKVEDPVYRPEHITFLSAKQWEDALKNEGFNKVLALPCDEEYSDVIGQHVIVAKKKKNGGKEAFQERVEEKIIQEKTFEASEEKEQESQKKLDLVFLDRYYEIKAEERQSVLREYLKVQLNTLLGYSPTETVDENVSLVELGVDSLMLIDLRVLLEEKLGVILPVGTFYDNSTISSLAEFYEAEMVTNRREINSTDQLIAASLKANAEDAFVPFPMNAVQKSYITRYDTQGTYLLTGGYYEFECKNLDIDRFDAAMDKLIAQHDMLKAVLVDDNRQVIIEDIPKFETDVIDLRGKTKDEINTALEEARNRENYALCETEMWPMFDIKAHQLEDKVILNIFLPGFLMDAAGVKLFFDGLKKYYLNPDTDIERTKLSFRNYVLDMNHLEAEEAIKGCKDYWKEQIAGLPVSIQLPVKKEEVSLNDYKYHTHYRTIDAVTWAKCKKKVSQMGLTPSGYLCSCLCQVLHQWSAMPKFSINAMAYNRFIPHDEIKDIMGNMSSTILLGFDSTEGNMEEQAKKIQKQLFDGLNHRYVSTVQILRELECQNIIDNTQRGYSCLLPVMYDGLIGIAEDESSYAWLGIPVYQRVERNPELLDCQVMESTEKDLILKWDTVDELLSVEKVNEMFDCYFELIKNAVK